MYGRNENSEKEIDLFIQRFLSNHLYTAAKDLLFANQDSMRIIKEEYSEPNSVKLENATYIRAANIETKRDELTFDAAMNCCLSGLKRTKKEELRLMHRLTLKCKVTLNNDEISFSALSAYRGNPLRNKDSKYPANESLVPVIAKDSLDMEAALFLSEYCPEALITPQPIPIMKILKEQMGLIVVPGGEVTSEGEVADGQVYGKIYFSPTAIKFQCPNTKVTKTVTVPCGTIAIDPAAMSLNNQGFLNNTLCHEGFHWFRHRIYAVICLMLYGEVFIACRVNNKTPIQNKWTNEQWVEWQARSVTPRILMPLKPFTEKAKDVFARYPDWTHQDNNILYEITKELADFYAVSFQSARIRLIETGFIQRNNKAADILESEPSVTTFINEADAFREYNENLEFRKLVDSGTVCYVENHFIINALRYIEQSHGQLSLTAYAKNHLDECALTFTMKGCSPLKGIAYRSDKKNTPRYEREQNSQRVLETTDEFQQLAERFENEFSESSAIMPTFVELANEIIKKKGWSYSDFTKNTNLDSAVYYRITKDKKPRKPNLRTVAAFCIGIGASIDTADRLLASAGFAIYNSKEIHAYRFVINVMRGRSIDDCNAFLETIGVEPLGVIESRQKKSVNE